MIGVLKIITKVFVSIKTNSIFAEINEILFKGCIPCNNLKTNI